jgi:hypothetical protein
LYRRLPFVPLVALESLLADPDLAERTALLVARHRAASAEALRRIAAVRRLMRNREIVRALVSHPNTALSIARNLVPHLFWRELAEITRALTVHPVVRRQAEVLLRVRLDEMASGERIAFARQASPALIPALLEDTHPRVLRSLLCNPRLVEQQAVHIGNSARASADLLDYLAFYTPWGKRPAVRSALLRNPRTAVATSLRLLRAVPGRDLPRLAQDASLPRIVRVGADRRLDSTRRPDPACGGEGT